MAYRWSIASPLTEQADRWSRELIISPLLAQCLLNRGINQLSVAQQFLQPQLNQLEDPFHIPDMEKAVELMYRYRETKRPLVIFGDYDVDGVTSTTLLLQILNELGWDARYHLPQRLDDGYGLSQAAQSCLEKTGAKLLLAVDCGSTASEVIDWMRDEGVEVIVWIITRLLLPGRTQMLWLIPEWMTARQPISQALLGWLGVQTGSRPRPRRS